ncbi:MAG: cobalamin-binding protein [Chitinivibrionales bacterium]|nr:cobalamin-binding protein [Chitinivibrionales bacterium]MBD3357942.1 cobalamin-binding protein [Chitinivibrionales bacterium]
MEKLITSLVSGDKKACVSETEKLLTEGVPKEEIVTKALEVAMVQMDDKCTAENFNLLEIMLAGRAVMSVMKVLFPKAEEIPAGKGTIVLATLEGDVHDLGKNIVKMVCVGKGYKVIDCGKSAPMNDIISKVQEHKPLALGISGLITSIIPMVKQVQPKLQAIGMGDVKILAGGAALKMAAANILNVDMVGETAFDAPQYLAHN